MARDPVGRWLRAGIAAYGIGAIGLGLTGFAWSDFALSWQPVPADVPHRALLAQVIAGAFIAAGLAVQFRRSANAGLVALVLLYAADCVLLQAPRIVAYPTIVVTWLGLAEQLALVLGGVVAQASLTRSGPLRAAVLRGCRRTFGVCLVVFASAHFAYPGETANMVPAWLPPTSGFWAYATGAAHLLAGIALVLDRLPVVASALVTTMFAGFGLLVWAPMLWPPTHAGAAGNAINLCLTGAAWILASAIASSGSERPTNPDRWTDWPPS